MFQILFLCVLNFFFLNLRKLIWIITETGKVGGTYKENEKLKKEIKKLEEENNLLKIKFELLLDMVIYNLQIKA